MDWNDLVSVRIHVNAAQGRINELEHELIESRVKVSEARECARKCLKVIDGDGALDADVAWKIRHWK